MKTDLLFSKADLHAVIQNQRALAAKEVDALLPDKVLNTPLEDLVTYIVEKQGIEALVLDDAQAQVGQRDTRVDVTNDPLRWIPDRGERMFVPGTEVTLYVPFRGDPALFDCRPSTFTLNPPRGTIDGNTLQLAVEVAEHDPSRVKAELDRLLSDVKDYIATIRRDLAPFQADLPEAARKRLLARKDKLLADQGLVASLGYPLRARPDSPVTYISTEVRRKATPKVPPSSPGSFRPEPAITLEEYDNIISILKRTASMLERSPAAFRGMDEENLRNQFLVPLNSHYEGQATGETFNFAGKTDILVRDGDRSVFVGECKIWRGPKSLEEALGQLLGYATWRDGKGAILLFNRNKDLSVVLAQVPDIAARHSSFKRALPSPDPAEYRFVAALPSEPGREMTVSILTFNVPA